MEVEFKKKLTQCFEDYKSLTDHRHLKKSKPHKNVMAVSCTKMKNCYHENNAYHMRKR